MKSMPEKTFNFRSYVITISSFDYKNEKQYYLGWVTKTNSKNRRAGHHCTRILSREDAARNLQSLRKLINYKWAQKQSKLAAKRKAKESFVNPYKVGQILHSSWGYDQTNIDYYQVTGLGKRSIKIREIASSCEEDGFMTGNRIPEPDKFVGPESTQIIQVSVYNDHARSYVADPSGHTLYDVKDEDKKNGIRCSWYA